MILAGILTEILSPQRGIIAYFYTLVGLEPVHWLTNKATFRGMLVVTGIWQGIGWSSIIYLAALSSIDPGLYESASIDGANRWQKALRITLPSLIPVMTILFLIQIGNILDESFAQIFNLYNPLVYPVADVFETYIYRSGIEEAKFDYSAAVGLFKNVCRGDHPGCRQQHHQAVQRIRDLVAQVRRWLLPCTSIRFPAASSTPPTRSSCSW